MVGGAVVHPAATPGSGGRGWEAPANPAQNTHYYYKAIVSDYRKG
jgi:hypothetical protein